MKSIEVSQSHSKLRFALFIFFIVLGLVSLGIGLFSLLKQDTGWQTVELQSGEEYLGGDIVLEYNIGKSGASAMLEYKEVARIYTDVANRMYRLLDSTKYFDSTVNLYSISRAPNQTHTVDPLLYEALQLLCEKGGRSLYLAPVYELYRSVVDSSSDYYASIQDPAKNEETRAYVSELLAFLSSDEHIVLRLLENNQVELFVSDAYLAFAQQWEIACLLDFGWYKNAFLVDAVAQELIKEGHTHGVISSYDGFSRNMDASGQNYSLNIYVRKDNEISMPARISYKGAAALVTLRDYPLSTNDRFRCYLYEDGTSATLYVDARDGLSKVAAHELTAISKTQSCAQTALSIAPVYIAQSLDTSALEALEAQGITSVYAVDGVVQSTNAALIIEPIS